MKKSILAFIFVIFLSIVLRFWYLGKVPSSPDWDEAALGYNAYSIFLTGRDEYGKFLPVVLRSFNDYKPALYSYLIIPFIKLFGLSVFSVRLPSAVIGVFMVVGMYYLFREFLFFQKLKNENIFTNWLPLIAAGMLSISPWHLQFTRTAFESSVGTAFNVFATFFFLKGFRNGWFLVLASVFYGLSLYVYQSEKVFIPLLLMFLFLIFRKNIFSLNKKYPIIACLVGFAIILPLVIFTLFNPQSLARAKGVSIFSDNNSLLETNVLDIIQDKKNNDTLSLFLDNRRFIYAKSVIWGYISHFDVLWLFLKGDFNLARHHVPDMGLLYIFELPLILIGIYQLAFNNSYFGIDKKIKHLIFSWYFIAPIPASITTDVPHGVRTLNFIAIYPVFTAIGIMTAYMFYKNFKLRIVKLPLFCIVIVMCTINFFYYINQYFVQQNYYNDKDWQYGYEQIVDYVGRVGNNYKKIIVSNKDRMDQSYMFFLFYLKYDPKKYLLEGGSNTGGQNEDIKKFSNFEFRSFDINREPDKKVLFIGSPNDLPQIFNLKYFVNYQNQEPAMYVVEK